ncbi:MAG TPA: hypothetical protein VK255_01445, partial [Patescibacteria group bacterium]|nr:hypothetical protein [Patescibacteria group bacterium]
MERPININLRSQDQSRIINPQNRRDFLPSEKTGEESEDGFKKDNKFIVKSFDRVIDVSLFMIFFGFPLYFTGLTFQGVIFEKQIYFYIWLLLGLVAWAAKGVTTGEMKIRRTPLDIPIAAFWVVYLLSTIFSVDKWHSFWGGFADPSRGLMSVSALIIAYYLIFSNFTIKRFRLMFSALVASGIIVSLWTMLAIMNIKFLPDSIAQYAPISLSGSVLGVAMIISALIPLITVSILKISENETMNRVGKKVILAVLLLSLTLNLFL